MRSLGLGFVVLLTVCMLPDAIAAQQSSTSEESSPVDRFVSQSTGDAMFQIPIPAPRGTGGFQPQLMLRYSSSAGDGPFGIGWQLPLGEIRRSTRFGIPTFVDGTDRFELDGELLVANPAEAGEFRLATEAFARITHDVQDESWLVEYPNGTKARYGTTEDSRIRRDGATGVVFRWLPSELEDASHNVVRFSYDRRDQGTAYPKEILYTYRGGTLVGGIARKIEFVLEQRPDPLHLFTGSVETWIQWRVKEIQSTVGGAPFRRLLLTYSAAGYTTIRSRIESARLYGADCALNENPIASCDGMPPQTFAYTDPAAEITATNWTSQSGFDPPVEFTDGQGAGRGGDNGVRIGDIDGDGRADLVRSVHGSGGKQVWLHNGDNGWTFNQVWTDRFKDLEYTDYNLQYQNEGCSVQTVAETPTPSFMYRPGIEIEVVNTNYNLVKPPRKADLVDINGDGLADVVVSMMKGEALIKPSETEGACSGPQITQPGTPIKYVWINTGAGWQLDTALSNSMPTLWSNFFLTYDPPGPKRGTVEAPSIVLVPNANGYNHGYQTFLYFDDHGGRYADLNGDGRLDLLFGRDDAHQRDFVSTAYLNTPAGWVQAPQFTPPVPFVAEYIVSDDHPEWTAGEDTGLRVVDLNGDGLADLVKTAVAASTDPKSVNQSAVFRTTAGVWLNTGRGWCTTPQCPDAAKYTPPAPFTEERGQDAMNGGLLNGQRQVGDALIPISTEMSFVDVNGDGKVDLLRSDGVPGNNAGMRAWLHDPHATSSVWVEDARFKPPVSTTTWESQENNTVDTGVRLLDLDLDGSLDFVRSDDNNSHRAAWLASARYSDRVSSHANGSGAVFAVTYALATGIANPALTTLAKQDATTLGENIATVTWSQRPVVDSITVSGIDIAPVTYEYSYAEPRWCPEQRSSLGFRATQTTNNVDSTFARTFFWQQHGRAGRPSRVEFWDGSSLLRKGTSTWQVLDGGQVVGSVPGAHVGRITSESTQNAYAGGFGALHSVEFGYDDLYGFNFVDSVEVTRPTSSLSVTRIPLPANTADWVVGLLGDETQVGPDGTVYRAEHYGYKPGTTLVTQVQKDIYRREPGAPIEDVANTDRVYDEYGNLRHVIELHAAGSFHTRSFCYDGDGELVTGVGCPLPPAGAVTNTHTVPRAVRDPLGGVSSFEVDLGTGRVRTVSRFNGDRASIVTDGFGRATEQWVQPVSDAQGTLLEVTNYFDSPSNPSGHSYVESLSEVGDGTSVREAEYFDGLGRSVRSVSPRPPQDFVGRFVARDYRGRQTSISHDVDCGASEHCNVTPPASALTLISYDGADRPLIIDTPESGILVNAYGFESRAAPAGPTGSDDYDVVLSKDGNGNLVRKLLDGQRTVWVEECEGTVGAGATDLQSASCGPHPTTFYTYEPTGEVSSIYDSTQQYASSAHRLTYIHDTLGNVRTIEDPDGGVTNTTYYVDGEVYSVTNARGQTTLYTYDALGRLETVDAPPGEHDTVITYDPHTRNRASTSKGGGVIRTQHFYDALGRENRKIASVLTTSMVMDFESDLLGRTKKVVYPESTSIHYVYSGAYLEKVCEMNATCEQPVTTWVSDVVYDQLGRERQFVEPPGTLSFDYDPNTYRLSHTSFQQASTGQNWLDLTFGYDALGNVQSITDGHNGPGQDNISATATYTYDARNRLSSWTWSGSSKYFGYDGLGNLTHKSVAAPPTAGNQNLVYGDPARPHAVTQHTSSNKSFTFDLDGNVTQRGGQFLSYDSANRLVCVGSTEGGCEIAQYAYDADGVLIAETGGGATRLHFEDLFIWDNGTGISTVFASGLTLGERHHSGASLRTAWLPPGWEPPVDPWLLAWLGASAGGAFLLFLAARAGVFGVLVRRPVPVSVALMLGILIGVPPEAYAGGGGGQAPARRWTYHDHLGNRVLYLNDTPELIYRRVFEPFGGVAAESVGTTQHERIFTGKREDPDTRVGGESGLINFGARWYDAEIGRFLSIDPVVQSVDDPQTHNPYGYVRNNPINQIDPDGREWSGLLSGLGLMTIFFGAAINNMWVVAAGALMASVGQQAAGNDNAALAFRLVGAIAMGMAGPDGSLTMSLMSAGQAAEATAGSILPQVIYVGASQAAAAQDLDQSKQEQDRRSTSPNSGFPGGDQVYTGAPDLPIEEAIGPIEIITGVYGGARIIYSGLRYGLPALCRWLASKGGREVVEHAAEEALKISQKIERQMARRGWTSQQIDEAVQSGKQVRAINKATGNPATRYVHPDTGQSVVVDDVTGEVIQVGGPGFKHGPGSGDLP